MKISSQKINTARDYIADCFCRIGRDGKFPSFRTMIQKSGTSRAAITRVLEEYEQRQLIRRHPRIGIVKNDMGGNSVIDIVACHDEGYFRIESGFLYECILGFIQTASKNKYTVRLYSVSQSDSLEKYLEIANNPEASAFVLVQPNMHELVTTFQQTGKPLVALFSQGNFANVNQVMDAFSIVRMQMDHLIKLGHSRILFLREESTFCMNFTMMWRRQEYYNIMARHGYMIPAHWRTEYPRGELHEALNDAFSREPHPTALIVYDLDVALTYAFLQERGYRIGDDVSVVATDGSTLLRCLEPSVTTVVSHSMHTAETVWALLKKQWSGNRTPQTLEIMLTFYQGHSTGPVNNQPISPKAQKS